MLAKLHICNVSHKLPPLSEETNIVALYFNLFATRESRKL